MQAAGSFAGNHKKAIFPNLRKAVRLKRIGNIAFSHLYGNCLFRTAGSSCPALAGQEVSEVPPM